MADELRDDLDLRPGLSHIQAHKDVLLVDARECSKRVSRFDAGLEQHSLICAVAVKDRRLGKKNGKLLAAGIVGFDDFDTKAGVEQLAGKIVCNASATDQNDLTDRAGSKPRLAEKRLRVAQAGDEADTVACGKAELSRGNIDLLLPALNHTNQQLRAHERGQLHECPALQDGTFRQPEL